MAYGYRLIVHKTDRRTKTGLRFIASYDYEGYSGTAMQDEIYALRQGLYPAGDGWQLSFEPMTVLVKSLMTGEDVEIDHRDRGGPCDPSTERYWSM